ncbi:hypothetical protein SPRG_19246 [Saprolegnia parasitica CBS 223.65]|uniref:HTH La-type RNA-binding domain-containing protein n=1 Tax=Saprolegnia parasitica (strain CBS 223.65) TaxID=695850 RepID=A0A067D3N7_SAPPC|nr:hypothetical protein SPRG_19246 [Saprolegnia parasitica CBS 223.65]KDO33622.1 hypothetical protein SPRG_19246 [Saprolegnia parasitica CBS 223.65]|eukprot:XP_012195665.1 hypothetical protein SPRG_19246 [Saprolegnia parasitica CBS 223.65]
MAHDAKESIVLVILSVFVCYSTVAWLRSGRPVPATDDETIEHVVAGVKPTPSVEATTPTSRRKPKKKKAKKATAATATMPTATTATPTTVETRCEPAPFADAPQDVVVDAPLSQDSNLAPIAENVKSTESVQETTVAATVAPKAPVPEPSTVEVVLATPPRRITKSILTLSPHMKPKKVATTTSMDFLLKEPIVPSSPTSCASTVSSSSFSPPKSCPGRVEPTKRSLSPIARPPPMLVKPKKLVRSHSSTADGRAWRDVLGGDTSVPPPPVLAKTVSLDASSTPLSTATAPSNPLVLQHIVDQIAYYFSDHNLLRDVFLRQRMDADGYVYMSVVMNFNRVRAMMSPTVPLLALVERLDASPHVTLLCKRKPNGDVDPSFVQLAKVRPATHWQQWVPANALPTHHPFDLLLRKANAATSA